MITEDLKLWLIEVNTNPCLEESSELLRRLLPRMLDDAFKLTLDVVFPPRAVDEAGVEFPCYPVQGHKDEENLWQPRICSLKTPFDSIKERIKGA